MKRLVGIVHKAVMYKGYFGQQNMNNAVSNMITITSGIMTLGCIQFICEAMLVLTCPLTQSLACQLP